MQQLLLNFMNWMMNGFQYLFFFAAIFGLVLVFVLMMIGIFKEFWRIFKKTLTFLK